MYEHLQAFLEKLPVHQLVATTVILSSGLALRWGLLRRITRAKISSTDLRRRWIVQIRSFSWFLIVLGMVIIWSPQLRTAALSAVAIFAALVLATKELLQCMSGGFLKIAGSSFVLGDRISIKGIRGEVIDQTLLSTTLLEIGPSPSIHQGTSRAVTIPNSMFLTEPIFNESFTKKYVLHTFVLPVKAKSDWQRTEKHLLSAAHAVCAPFLEDAKKHMAHLTKYEGFDTPSVDPRVTFTVPEPDRIDLIVRVPTPADRKGRVEQDILRRVLIAMSDSDQAEPSPAI